MTMKIENAIKLAANNIEELRGVDVYRILDTYFENRFEIADYIKKNRHDLIEVVNEELLELEE
jgi:hypothetical protein